MISNKKLFEQRIKKNNKNNIKPINKKQKNQPIKTISVSIEKYKG